MKKKEVVEKNKEEEEGISKSCYILKSRQTDIVQFENREYPASHLTANCPLWGWGVWFNNMDYLDINMR